MYTLTKGNASLQRVRAEIKQRLCLLLSSNTEFSISLTSAAEMSLGILYFSVLCQGQQQMYSSTLGIEGKSHVQSLEVTITPTRRRTKFPSGRVIGAEHGNTVWDMQLTHMRSSCSTPCSKRFPILTHLTFVLTLKVPSSCPSYKWRNRGTAPVRRRMSLKSAVCSQSPWSSLTLQCLLRRGNSGFHRICNGMKEE